MPLLGPLGQCGPHPLLRPPPIPLPRAAPAHISHDGPSRTRKKSYPPSLQLSARGRSILPTLLSSTPPAESHRRPAPSPGESEVMSPHAAASSPCPPARRSPPQFKRGSPPPCSQRRGGQPLPSVLCGTVASSPPTLCACRVTCAPQPLNHALATFVVPLSLPHLFSYTRRTSSGI